MFDNLADYVMLNIQNLSCQREHFDELMRTCKTMNDKTLRNIRIISTLTQSKSVPTFPLALPFSRPLLPPQNRVLLLLLPFSSCLFLLPPSTTLFFLSFYLLARLLSTTFPPRASFSFLL